jgi:Fe-S cluster assembly ATP-binding protein
LLDGRIVKSGDKQLALELEERGYDWLENELAPACQEGFLHD